MIQDIHICWNSTYLMLSRIYQLYYIVNIWIEEGLKNNFQDVKISIVQLYENDWSFILLIENMLNSLYELTLIIFCTVNADIYFEF